MFDSLLKNSKDLENFRELIPTMGDNGRDTREVFPINILRETLGNAMERFFGRVQR